MNSKRPLVSKSKYEQPSPFADYRFTSEGRSVKSAARDILVIGRLKAIPTLRVELNRSSSTVTVHPVPAGPIAGDKASRILLLHRFWLCF